MSCKIRRLAFLVFALASGCDRAPSYDVILRGGTIVDGSGEAPHVGDVALVGDSVAAVGDLRRSRGRTEIDVRGLAVAPGFINMLSWYTESEIVVVEPRGVIQVGRRTIAVRAVRTRSEQLNDLVSRAYLSKYHTPGSIGYARDLGRAKSRATTTELVPWG